MRLKLANWPPLLSHLLMIVFGMGVHSVLTPARPHKGIKLRSQRVYIVVPKKMQIYRPVKKKQTLVFSIKKPAQARCALPARGTRLEHSYKKTLLLSLTTKQASLVIYHLQQKTLEGLFAADDSRGKQLPSCTQKPTVAYGMP